MLTGYFDDAGGADHGFTVVAGWVSTIEQWQIFNNRWSEMLATYQVPWFDMKTLSHFKGEYALWKETPTVKDAFVAEACKIIASTAMFQFASSVPHSAFASVNKSYRLKEYVGNEYALAGLTCALKMREWAQGQGFSQHPEMIFDDGTAKKGKLTDIMLKEHFDAPIFASPLPKDGRMPVVQLQAADFLAYEIRKMERDDPSEIGPEERRISLRKLIWIPSDWGEYTEKDLIETCKRHPLIGERPDTQVVA
jgi:hypothetical protein